jgi:hypothetical protein
MAEFLIRRENHRNRDIVDKTSFTTTKLAEIDTTHEKGDIVQVYEDRTCKEAPSSRSIYYIIKVPGLKKCDFEHLNQPQTHSITENINGRLVERQTMDKRRQYKIDYSLLDSKVYDKLRKELWIELTEKQWNDAVFNKKEGKTIAAIGVKDI